MKGNLQKEMSRLEVGSTFPDHSMETDGQRIFYDESEDCLDLSGYHAMGKQGSFWNAHT